MYLFPNSKINNKTPFGVLLKSSIFIKLLLFHLYSLQEQYILSRFLIAQSSRNLWQDS